MIFRPRLTQARDNYIVPIGRLLLLSLFLLTVQADAQTYRGCSLFLEEISQPSQSDIHPFLRDRPQHVNPKQIHVLPLRVVNISGDFPNINVTDYTARDQDEPSIAINPLEGRNIIIGANDYRALNTLWAYNSTDGGLTWGQQPLPPRTKLAYATDPSVVFGANGIAYFAFGRAASGGVPYPENDVVEFASTDLGKTWNGPSSVFQDTMTAGSAQVLSDKYYIAVDRSQASPYLGRLYVAWTELQNAKTRLVLSYSTNGGQSWSQRVAVTPDQSFYISPIPAVGPNGELYVTFVDQDSTVRKIYVSRSINGGALFQPKVTVAEYNELGPLYPEGSPEAHPIIKGHLRVNSFPTIAVDQSAKASGKVYVSWTSRDDNGRAHVFLSTSNNSGSTWSAPRPIDGDTSTTNTDKFFPWIAVDPINGDVGVAFNDSRLDPARNQMTDLFLTFSTDAGASWRARRISNESYNPSISIIDSLYGLDTSTFFGDYIGLDAQRGVWRPAWTDTRSGFEQEIYTAIVRPYQPRSIENLTITEQSGSLPRLAWKYRPETTFGFSIGPYRFHLYRSDGKEALLSSDFRGFLDSSVVAGVTYEYAIRAELLLTGDTSGYARATFSPLNNRTSLSPEIAAAAVSNDGNSIEFKVPSKNERGTEITGLEKIYFYSDGVLLDSLNIGDGLRGAVLQYTIPTVTGRFHNIQLSALTNQQEIQTESALSSPRYLFAGEGTSGYVNRFDPPTYLYTPNAWQTTTAGGAFKSSVINDSLPFVNYAAGTNSVLLLPAVKAGAQLTPIGFRHFAAVAVGDSAIVEFSTDAGFSFTKLAAFDRSMHSEWSGPLGESGLFEETRRIESSDFASIVVRFRLSTNSASGDGWFIDDIAIGDGSKVAQADRGERDMRVTHDPQGNTILLLSSATTVGIVRIYDVLGRYVGGLNVDASVLQTRLLLPRLSAGAYWYEFVSEGAAARGSFIQVYSK